jgi:hypothetical protein
MEKCKFCGNIPNKMKSICGGIYYACSKNKCAVGPAGETQEDAISLWNELMRTEPVENQHVKKPVRIPFHMVATETALYVMCSDGALFKKAMKSPIDEEWDELPVIPGTAADMACDLKG